MSKKCPICGKTIQGFFQYCADCNKLIKEGKVTKCKECGTWHDSKTPCPTCSKKQHEEPVHAQAATGPVKCILCGKPTYGANHFCYACYKKYSNKILNISIKNCVEVDIQEASYEGTYSCTDGHKVKSKDEKMIDDYLFKKGISHAYEKAVPIDENSEHDIHPDFYLPGYKDGTDVYLEHFGFDQGGEKYARGNAYKIDQYKKLGLTVFAPMNRI